MTVNQTAEIVAVLDRLVLVAQVDSDLGGQVAGQIKHAGGQACVRVIERNAAAQAVVLGGGAVAAVIPDFDDLLQRVVDVAVPEGLAFVEFLHGGDLFLHIAVADLLFAVGCLQVTLQIDYNSYPPPRSG